MRRDARAGLRPAQRNGSDSTSSSPPGQTGWCRRSLPQPTDRFLEIGPGPGALTLRLAPLVTHVTAVELDREMAEALRRGCRRTSRSSSRTSSTSTCWRPPAATSGWPAISPTTCPRQSSSSSCGRAATAAGSIDATLMVQREVADRIEGTPGTKDYGTLAIFVQLRANVRRLLTLPPGAFRPVPKVHSAVLRFEFRDPVVGCRTRPCSSGSCARSSPSAARPSSMRSSRSPRSGRSTRGGPSPPPAWTPRLRPEALQLAELARLADVFVASSSSPSE